MSSSSLFGLGLTLLLLFHEVVSLDYKAALTKSLLYFEAQRSGKLPPNQRVQWRADSALKDRSPLGIDLVGGYYDAGDNVKFGFPMAYTVTMLAWSTVEFGSQLEAKNELSNALDAIKWGTDYLIKAHPHPNVLYGEVGDGDSDHRCWQRPEDMTTPRGVYKITEANPGSELAGETSAAFAAAAIAFNKTNPTYSSQLLTHAKQLFDFGTNHHGNYMDSIPTSGKYYPSSGYSDELLWAAAWIHRATYEDKYLIYLHQTDSGGPRTIFSWDDKYLGVDVLVAKLVLEGKVNDTGNPAHYKSQAEQFICNCIQKGSNNAQMSNAGLLWWQADNNIQYVTSALLATTAYSDYLTAANVSTIQCQSGSASPADLIKFVQSQVDYILGLNPKNTSYMVGFGSNYPQKVHHRGASIVSIKSNPTPVTCQGGYDNWFNRDSPNPNVLDGAMVGGPDESDNYSDSRSNYQQAEAATANSAPFVGVLARLA